MNDRVLIIAEAGVNHNGDFDLALRMVDVAREAGADVVKFQTAVPELVMSRHASKAEYQKNLTGAGESVLEMSRKMHLPLGAYRAVKAHCEKRGIEFLSTPFDLPSVDALADLGVGMLKIPSGEITNLPYLRKIGALRKKVILSTGMSTLGEIESALTVLTEAGTARGDLLILHCNSQYPTPYEDVNLRAMLSIREAFGLPVGYSDHSLGIEVPVAAVALGATVIEKHFTLDRTMKGPDHQASLEPAELKAMVQAIRNVEKALGDGIKRVSPSERSNMVIARKSIHAARDLRAGETLRESDVTMKRPGSGISPMLCDLVIGRRLRQPVAEDTLIAWGDLE